MPHHIRTVCAGVAAVLLLLPAPALAHGGDSSPGASPSAPSDAHDMSGHDLSGHDMEGMEGMEGMDGMDMSGEADTHDHGSSGSSGPDHGTTAEDHAGHEQTGHEPTGDTVSPEMRTLVLTGFGSINGAVVVAAFLIRRQRPPRERGARR